MFLSGQSVYSGMIFSVLSFLIGIPVGHQGVQLDRDDVQGVGRPGKTPMLYAIGFIGLFTVGGLTGLFLSTLGAPTFTCTTRTSSSPTSTTSWSAGR